MSTQIRSDLASAFDVEGRNIDIVVHRSAARETAKVCLWVMGALRRHTAG